MNEESLGYHTGYYTNNETASVATLSHPEGIGHLNFAWFTSDRWVVIVSYLPYEIFKSEGWEFHKTVPTTIPKDLARKVWNDLLERGYREPISLTPVQK